MANLKKNKLFLLQIIPFLLCQLFSIRYIVKRHKVDIIHSHWLIPQSIVAVLYKVIFNRKIKILATIHGSDLNSFNSSFYKIILRFTLNNVDKLTVVSNALKEKVLTLGYNKDIFVYPMGVDTQAFNPNKKNISLKTQFSITGFFLLFVGSIIQSKGIVLLLEAMPKVIEKYPDAKLVVVGDGTLKQKVIELCDELEISDKVVLTGKIRHEALPEYFATADLFILPSFSEGFGLVIAEALSSGTLALTSNLPPINDIIIENQTGFYLDRIDSIAISDKIIRILSNVNSFENIRNDGREHVVRNFDWESVSNNYIRLITNI